MCEIIVINPTKKPERMSEKLKVAAYVRVSSDSDDQENSFINQYDYYSRLIANEPSWLFADVYADNGITGTELDNREEFKRMVQDCYDGKIDYIITKSVSRFARNTYDCLNTIRSLKALGVNVKFEKEGIDTKTMKSEVELAALSSMAQEESISLSKNVQMGVRHRMINGTFKQGCLPYGFTGKDGEFNIFEEQAKVVKWIFNSYVEGKSLALIARELTEAGIVKNDGKSKWNPQMISYIIKNVRYKGDALLQKTYTTDFPFKSVRNTGERDMYYIKNANPPIVSSELFDKANTLLKNQSKRFTENTKPYHNPLTRKIYCAECGTLCRRKSGEVNTFWVCRNRDESINNCPAPQIAQQTIYRGFVKMYNRLINNMEYILTPMTTQLREFREMKLQLGGEVKNINDETANMTEQVLILNQLNADGYIEPALYIEQINDLNRRIQNMKKQKKLLLGTDECEKTIRATERIEAILKSAGALADFDESVFGRIIQRIWIDREKTMTFELTNGLKLKIDSKEVE